MDRKQIQHDLALAYAKAKMQIALEREELDPQDDSTVAAHDLLSWYRDCLNELSQIKDEDFVDLWGSCLE